MCRISSERVNKLQGPKSIEFDIILYMNTTRNKLLEVSQIIKKKKVIVYKSVTVYQILF